MPKIRDLGISAIPIDDPVKVDPAYWMCIQKGTSPPKPPEPCQPTKCNPSGCNPSPRPKNAAGLPHEAVVLLKQQLQHQIRQFRA